MCEYSSSIGEGRVAVMPGVRKVLKLAHMGAEARPTDLFSLERALDRGHIVAAV
jgi:hypothetical protein